MKFENCKMKLGLIITFLITGAAPVPGVGAEPPPLKPYSYRLNVPAEGENCDAHARNLAGKFAKATGAASVEGQCENRQPLGGESALIDTIIISYQSAAQVTPFRAIIGGTTFMNEPRQSSGVFPSYAGCLSEMPRQEKLFEKETGLAAVDAYCSPSDDSFHPGYSMTIEGYGTSGKSLFAFTQTDYIYADQSQEDLIQAAAKAVGIYGGDVAFADAHHLFYYYGYEIPVVVELQGTFPDAAQCESQKAAAQSIFSAAGLAGISVMCRPFSPQNANQETLTVVGAGPYQLEDDQGLNSDKYSSFSECQGDMARVTQNARSNGYNLLGALCEPDEMNMNSFLIHLFTKSN